jgi:hypothetical protein
MPRGAVSVIHLFMHSFMATRRSRVRVRGQHGADSGGHAWGLPRPPWRPDTTASAATRQAGRQYP